MTIAKSVTIVLVVAVAAPARAQSVEAEVLFREGKRLLKEGKIAEACDKLEASDRLESTVGSLLNLADCREKNHQLATAWVTFHKAVAVAKTAHDVTREAEARRREKAIQPRLAYLTVSVPAESRLEGLAIVRDGAPIDPALWNQPVPMDAGDHELAGTAPGHERWTKHVTISDEGQAVSIDMPRLMAHDKLSSDPTKLLAESEPMPVERDRASSFTGTRKAAIAAGVVGAVGIGVGVVFGVKGQSAEKQSDMLCSTTSCSDPTGLQLNRDARSDALVATVGFIAGGALVAGAVVMWLVGGPKAARDGVAVTPAIRSDRVGVDVGWRF